MDIQKIMDAAPAPCKHDYITNQIIHWIKYQFKKAKTDRILLSDLHDHFRESIVHTDVVSRIDTLFECGYLVLCEDNAHCYFTIRDYDDCLRLIKEREDAIMELLESKECLESDSDSTIEIDFDEKEKD